MFLVPRNSISSLFIVIQVIHQGVLEGEIKHALWHDAFQYHKFVFNSDFRFIDDEAGFLIIILKVGNKKWSQFVHHHSFNVSVPLKVGRTAPMFVLSFFLHFILFAGSALDSFQCLRSLLIVSFHVFFGLPRPRCPTTSNSVMLLIQPSFLTIYPNQCSRLYRNKVCMLLIPSFLRRESELMWSFKCTLHVHQSLLNNYNSKLL